MRFPLPSVVPATYWTALIPQASHIEISERFCYRDVLWQPIQKPIILEILPCAGVEWEYYRLSYVSKCSDDILHIDVVVGICRMVYCDYQVSFFPEIEPFQNSGPLKREITVELECIRQVLSGSIVCSDSWRGYSCIASGGFVHCRVNHGGKLYSKESGNHVNRLESF